MLCEIESYKLEVSLRARDDEKYANIPSRHESALIEQNSIKLDEERVKLLESRSVIEDREGRR